MQAASPPHLAIIGGGRWAHVVAGALRDIVPQGTRLSLCSPSHPGGWHQWTQAQAKTGPCHYRVIEEMDALPGGPSVDGVFVVRAARHNAATALVCLERGIPTFVEKPFALNVQQAQAVVDAAHGVFCMTGLVFSFAANIRTFFGALAPLGDVREIDIQWTDPGDEVRHGAHKAYDVSLNCVLDVFPHIWSLLRLLSDDGHLVMGDVQIQGGGQIANLRLSLDAIQVNVDIARNAPRRARRIEIKGARGVATMDFSDEPGLAHINGLALDVASGFSSPLTAQLGYFLDYQAGRSPSPPCHIERAVESISMVDGIMQEIRAQQVAQIIGGVQPGAQETQRQAMTYAVREVVADWLLDGNNVGGGKPVGREDINAFTVATCKWLQDKAQAAPLPPELRYMPLLNEIKNGL